MAANRRSHLRRLLAGTLLGATLAGCATAPPAGRYGTAAPEPVQYTVMSSILNVLALPLYLPFKAAVCATTVVLAAPATAIHAVTDPDGTGWQREAVNEGFATNCGPPWIP